MTSTASPLTSSFNRSDENFEVSSTEVANNTVTFKVEFYHCEAGSFWNHSVPNENMEDDYNGACQPCREDELIGDTEVCAVVGSRPSLHLLSLLR